MANTKSTKKNYLTYLLLILIAVCTVLLLVEISTNTKAEIEANQSYEGYAVHAEFDLSGQIIESTPTPRPTRDPSLPTPTYDITHGE